jgi:hypothetical protein
MANIKSDIANRNFVQSGFREYEVNDESSRQESSSNEVSIEDINRSLISRGLPPIDRGSFEETGKRSQGDSQFKNSTAQSAQSYFLPPDDDINVVERKIAEAKTKRSSGASRLSEGAKKRIEMLCGISRNFKEVDVDGNQFVLRTLKSKELLEALVSSAKLDGTISLPFQTRKELLARSLVKIAATDVYLFLGDDSIEARLEFLDELEEPIIEKLYREYTLLVDEVNNRYGLNESQVAKEVPEDIKK